MNIVSRSEWGATPWQGQPYSVTMSEKTHHLVHYHGGKPAAQRGVGVPRNVEKIHLANGWSGVGYNFLVDMDGVIYEGRGWGLVGAHCPGKNRDGIGVYLAVGGDQEPTEAAKRAVVWLYAEAQRRAGHRLTLGVHGDYWATACAGDVVDPWVHAGMPLESTGGAQDGPAVVIPVQDEQPAWKPLWTPTGKMSVKEIQAVVKVTQDGLYGEATKAAVARYQRELKVTADGYWGKITEAAHFAKEKAAATTDSSLVVDGLLGPATYKALQKHVGVTADGIWGPATRRAMQRWLGVTADGIVGRVTVRALQRKVGATVDGDWGRGTTRALQTYLNRVS